MLCKSTNFGTSLGKKSAIYKGDVGQISLPCL